MKYNLNFPNSSFIKIFNQALYCLLLAYAAILIAKGSYDSFSSLTAVPAILAMLLFSTAFLGFYLYFHKSKKSADPNTVSLYCLFLNGLICSWIAYRLFLPYTWHVILIPLVMLCWIAKNRSLNTFLMSGGIVLLIESGIYFSAHQSLLTFLFNIIVLFGISLLFIPNSPFSFSQSIQLPFFPYKSSSFNRNDEQQAKKQKQEFGSQIVSIPIAAPSIKQVQEQLHDSLNNQLEIIRQAFGYSTLLLLWPTNDPKQFTIKGLSTIRSSVLEGPFSASHGIIAGLQQEINQSIGITEVIPSTPALPYYDSMHEVGSFLAEKFIINTGKKGDEKQSQLYGILCADRKKSGEWPEHERLTLRNIADKFATDFNTENQLLAISYEHDKLQRVCVGLRELNGVLGLESVYEATIKAVSLLIVYDLLAINLKIGNMHQIVKILGQETEDLLGQEFSIDEGLVGQVIKRNHWLPAVSTFRKDAPIFTNKILYKQYRSLLILPLRNEDGQPIGALTIASKKPNIFSAGRRQILELIATQVAVKIDLAQAHEKINQLATTDGLTGLANHRTFQHGFNVMIERTNRNQCPLCLIFCDIDHFKKINDTYGHPFGDKVLKKVASVLQSAVRKVDLASRYGGEEFAILLEGADEKGGLLLAERLRRDIEGMIIRLEKELIPITMSMGLSFFPKDGESKEDLISKADQALYKAKATGRNRIVSWSDIVTSKTN